MNESLIKDLLNEATNAAKKAHAPYSQFPVGTVVLLKNGERIVGANIENASFPVGICAERSAMAQVVMQEQQKNVELVVVVTPSEQPSTPCGMCRQFLSEFLPSSTPIIFGDRKGHYEITSMGTLLPHAFNKRDMSRDPQ